MNEIVPGTMLSTSLTASPAATPWYQTGTPFTSRSIAYPDSPAGTTALPRR